MANTPAATSLSLSNDLGHIHQQNQTNPSSTVSYRPYDFWEFISCGKCHLPFVNDSAQDGIGGPTIPFWLTECGHILCNQHLNPNQSCPCCGANGIEVTPLHRELPPPMSDWFQSTPHKLDGLAQAVKFQQESLISLVRYYKRKVRKYEVTLERVRPELQEIKALKMKVEHLRQENANMQQYLTNQQQGQYQIPADTSDTRNVNGKRRMLDSHYKLASSPRSIMTPIAPSRLTLGPDHEPPSLPAKNSNVQMVMDGSHSAQTVGRPGANQFAQKYAYVPPPQTPRGHNQQQVLSHVQQAPLRRAMNPAQAPNPMHGQTGQQQMMMQATSQGISRNMRLQTDEIQAQRMMLPPPTPLHVRQAQAQGVGGQPRRPLVAQQQHRSNQGMMVDNGLVVMDDQQGNFQNQSLHSGQYQAQRGSNMTKFRPAMSSRQLQGQNLDQVQQMQKQHLQTNGSGFSFSSHAQQQLPNQSSRHFVSPMNASSGAAAAQPQMRGNRMVPATPSTGRFSAAVAPTPSNRHLFKPSTSVGGSRARAAMPNEAFLNRNRSLGAASN